MNVIRSSVALALLFIAACSTPAPPVINPNHPAQAFWEIANFGPTTDGFCESQGGTLVSLELIDLGPGKFRQMKMRKQHPPPYVFTTAGSLTQGMAIYRLIPGVKNFNPQDRYLGVAYADQDGDTFSLAQCFWPLSDDMLTTGTAAAF